MRIDYFKEYSYCLNRDMEYKVYGHSGKPILVFPAQNGRFYDFENFNMVYSIEHIINSGNVQLFCCDSIDKETWSNVTGDKGHRIYMHEQWYYYIVNELVPRILEINKNSNGYYANGILTTGCSLGATHAVNFMFRRPDIFNGCIGLSGYYDTDFAFDSYCDDLVYRNSPIKYLSNMSQDHEFVNKYRQNKIIICCGSGAWEDEMTYSLNKIKNILDSKHINAWVDIWGADVDHDWNWWRSQLPYFIENII
ncbi:MAG: esterase family protein [Peptostreptococcaceae bacterium]